MSTELLLEAGKEEKNPAEIPRADTRSGIWSVPFYQSINAWHKYLKSRKNWICILDAFGPKQYPMHPTSKDQKETSGSGT